MNRYSRLRTVAVVLASSLAGLAPAVALGAADDFVFEPYADTGTRVLQYTGGLERERGRSSEVAHSLGAAWGVSERWFTAAYAGWYREPGESFGFESVSWLNHVMLTSAATPTAIGAYLEIERPADRSQGYGFTWGPTLQFSAPANTRVTLNLWLQKNVRGSGGDTPTALVYQWQAKKLWWPHVELGLQGFGDFGPWRHWAAADEQEHSIGPALFVKWALGYKEVIRMDAGALVGVGPGSPRATFRLRTQYEF